MLWVVMLAALAAVVFAAAMPQVISMHDRAEAQTTANDLAIFGVGVSVFFVVLGNTPGRLSELDSTITTNRTLTPTACYASGPATTFSTKQVTTWGNVAPFTTIFAGSHGVFTPLGIVLDSIQRIPLKPTKGTDTLALLVPAVDSQLAVMLDEIVDNGNGAAAGAVQWTVGSPGQVNVKYRVPFAANGSC